jgi:hypothetical protein
VSKERYVNLSDRQVKDTQNQSQDFMSINTICRRLNEQDTTIADLEAKLAKNKKWLASNEGFLENEKLKQQLAEKEKERHEEWKTDKEWKWEWQKANQQLEQANQDKISFCIERLEEVKAVIKARLDIIEENYSEDFYDRKEYIDMSVENDNILKAIDNQIKQLKEMK